MDTSEETILTFAAGPEARGPGEDRDFEQLFLDYYPRLVRILLPLTGNPAQAEELAPTLSTSCTRKEARASAMRTPPAGSTAPL